MEAMQELVQATWAESSSAINKAPTFKMDAKEEQSSEVHLIQAKDEESLEVAVACATT